ncbi:MAG TPA: peptide-methionine (S)-S-oxide reductase MsrA [Gudongella oleilytica]|jgi:peptide-methionine (S)-S-oxide reductase|nr:peptide-methionine (S)-S-oxide reductase MsrA [Gudongella oleilytica]
MKDIYLAGGCFWGVQEYFSRIEGVVYTETGYANGKTKEPDYRSVCTGTTGHAETVFVRYDEEKVGLKYLLEKFFRIIDPTLMNRQGNDIGTQYRTGIYYVDEEDAIIAKAAMDEVQKKYKIPLATELMPLSYYYPAEDYHQDYLKKNPFGYCHINLNA